MDKGGAEFMAATMPHTRRDSLLNSVKPRQAKASLDLNDVEGATRLLRGAIARTGMSQKEAMDALGVSDKGYFSRMLDGAETLSIRRLLRREAQAIWCELIFLSAQECGMEVERVIRIREKRA